MMNMIRKYAHLLCNYSLELKRGEKLYIRTTTLAEDLVREVYREALRLGAFPEVDLGFREKGKILFEEADDDQLAYEPILYKAAVQTFDAALFIRAPYNHSEERNIDPHKRIQRSNALKQISDTYSDRTADRSLKRSLCEYPTAGSAQIAGMSLEDYEHFIFNACRLYDDDPVASWKEVGRSQQKIVDFLNASSSIRYVAPKTDISFSVKGRVWINSDGKTNMPSGEVFTGPVEDTVDGHVYFDYPAVFRGEEVRGVALKVSKGEVVSWSAEMGQTVLDEVMQIDGARYFGEVAIGTNYNITQPTKNILFDEKIGGTIHMALGQSYKQTGGKNESIIHWDLISDMTQGAIFADNQKIYEKGRFLIF